MSSDRRTDWQTESDAYEPSVQYVQVDSKIQLDIDNEPCLSQQYLTHLLTWIFLSVVSCGEGQMASDLFYTMYLVQSRENTDRQQVSNPFPFTFKEKRNVSELTILQDYMKSHHQRPTSDSWEFWAKTACYCGFAQKCSFKTSGEHSREKGST